MIDMHVGDDYGIKSGEIHAPEQVAHTAVAEIQHHVEITPLQEEAATGATLTGIDTGGPQDGQAHTSRLLSFIPGRPFPPF